MKGSAPPALEEQGKRAEVPVFCCVQIECFQIFFLRSFFSGSTSYPQGFIAFHVMQQCLEAYGSEK